MRVSRVASDADEDRGGSKAQLNTICACARVVLTTFDDVPVSFSSKQW